MQKILGVCREKCLGKGFGKEPESADDIMMIGELRVLGKNQESAEGFENMCIAIGIIGELRGYEPKGKDS